MDNISVPSRFSCLKIEDEGFHPASNKNKKKSDNSKQIVKKTANVTPINNAKKAPPKQNGTTNGPSKASSKKNKAKAKQEDKQWQEWKKKDEEYVDENFEQDMQCALIQSKLDFETQKNSVSVVITTQDKNKKKKSKTMSLDQFLDNSNQDTSKNKENQLEVEDSEKFFEKAIISAKEEMKREKVEEKRRERSNNIEEVITLVQCQEKLKKELEKNEELQKELEEAKKEIIQVKKRNKTLCSMLSQGEMKDKAAVLLELEKLTTVKEELTEEVTRLHKLLEQERSSKVSSSSSIPESHNQNAKHKDKNKKKKK